jgi:hypothetical protein
MCDDKTFVEVEGHVGRADFGAPAADQNVIDNDPNVLLGEAVEDEHMVSGQDASCICW